MNKLKSDSKSKKNSLTKFKVIYLLAITLTSLGLIIHQKMVSETNAYFINTQKDDVTLTVTNDVYGSFFPQSSLLDGLDTQLSVQEDVYKQEQF